MQDRPPPKNAPIVLHGIEFTGMYGTADMSSCGAYTSDRARSVGEASRCAKMGFDARTCRAIGERVELDRFVELAWLM